MSGEYEYQDSDDRAVQGEPAKLSLLDYGDHGLAGEQSGKEGGDEADDQTDWTQSPAQFGMPGGCLEDVQGLFSDDRNEDHQEGELGHDLTFDAAEKTGGYGGSGA